MARKENRQPQARQAVKRLPNTPSLPSTADKAASKGTAELPFSRMNYILLLVGIGIIALGTS